MYKANNNGKMKFIRLFVIDWMWNTDDLIIRKYKNQLLSYYLAELKLLLACLSARHFVRTVEKLQLN